MIFGRDLPFENNLTRYFLEFPDKNESRWLRLPEDRATNHSAADGTYDKIVSFHNVYTRISATAWPGCSFPDNE